MKHSKILLVSVIAMSVLSCKASDEEEVKPALVGSRPATPIVRSVSPSVFGQIRKMQEDNAFLESRLAALEAAEQERSEAAAEEEGSPKNPKRKKSLFGGSKK